MTLEEIYNVQEKFHRLFYFYDYSMHQGKDFYEEYCNEFSQLISKKINEWSFSKRFLCHYFYINLEFVFEEGTFINQYDIASKNKRGKQYFIELQNKIDTDFNQYSKSLNIHDLKNFSLFDVNNEYLTDTAFFDLYFSSLSDFKRAKFSYIVDNNKDFILNRFGISNELKSLIIKLNELFPEETKLCENIFDNRIGDYLVSRYLKNEFKEERTGHYQQLTFENEPVFKLFFKSKASFEIFKETILPEEGEEISKPELKQIFEFYNDNKLKHQVKNYTTPTKMSVTSKQSSFIRAINPFFKIKYDKNTRIDNAQISSKTPYPVYERLQENYEIMKDRAKEINST